MVGKTAGVLARIKAETPNHTSVTVFFTIHDIFFKGMFHLRTTINKNKHKKRKIQIIDFIKSDP